MMAIIRSSSEAIITIDESQHIVIFNPMAEQVFGCSATDAIGSPIERFIPARFRDAYRRDIEQFGQTSVVDLQMGRQRVIYGVRDSGEEFPIEASISQILDGNAKLYTVMLRDVTKRTAVEEELKRSRKELRDLSANLQIVREEEKTRIARELHDDLGQQLTALKMDLSSVEQALEGIEQTPPRVLSQLNGMRRLIDTTVGSVRRIAADLRPVMLDDLGLMPAIEWLINDFTTRYGIEVERRIDLCEVLFSRNGATTIFRIMQEALTNVVRHAEATHVTIAIAIEDEQCLMRIADNGRGASAAADAAGHEAKFGLLGIRERAHILGGEVSIETKSRQGFAITVALPLAAIQQEEALP
jgi:PAS domain S-box-containing protein